MKGGECKLAIQEDHRSFLKNAKVSTYSGNKKVAIIAAFLLLIAMSLMIVFTFQSINGIRELRQEVEALKSAIKTLQKKIDEDRGDPDQLKDLLKVPKEDSHNDTSDDIFYSDYDYEPIDDDEDDYLSDYETDPSFPEEYDDAFSSNFSNTLPLTGEEYTKDAKTATVPPRTKRSIVGYTQDEIPTDSKAHAETRRRNVTFKKSHHHGSTPPPPSSYSYQFHPQLRTDQDVEITTLPATAKHARRSHSRQGFRHQLKSGDSQSAPENPDVEFTVVGDDQVGTGRTRHRPRRLELDERHVRTGRMRPLPTAHFYGDTSKYVLGQHDNFNGNGHLRHPQRTYVDWVESSWFQTLGMDRHFSLNDGVLTIKESGLYFIYAQIYYYDEHDMNGFRVYKNENDTLLQCTTMTHSTERVMKGNTCFTASAEYLSENDRISLGDLSDSRYSLFEPGKSFFGVIKLGDVKIK